MKIEFPENVTQGQLEEHTRLCVSEYAKAHKRAYQLDSIDRGRLWSSLQTKFPTYQLLPDTNHVSYIKNNILASIYTVGKSAKLLATSEADKDVIENLNIAMDHIWATRKVGWYQMLAGERAALMNLGVTQVGWDNSIVTGKDKNFGKGQVVLKNINPLRYYRDPYAESLDTAQFVIVWDDYHESVIKSNPNYKEAFTRLKNANQLGSGGEMHLVQNTDRSYASSVGKPGYYRIYTHWIRQDGKIHELHMLNDKHLLFKIEDIQPNMFPFAELYCNLPAGDLLGTSEPAKIAANSVVYNVMNSIIMTSEYKNQRPPRFINGQSGINVNAFTKYGNDADQTFITNGDVSRSVYYHQFPQPTAQAMQTMGFLAGDIQLVSGVDGRYTGRDSGSILTTGGINSMLDQATMIDAPKVENYQDYCKTLSQLIAFNYINHSATKRSYLKLNKATKSYTLVEVDFPSIPADTMFEYELMISSELPKNKARLEAVADKIMEKQMQYSGAGIDVDLITPEEWLEMQDIPIREQMQERMGIQKTQNWTALVAQAVTEYASLVEQGVPSADAMAATAETLKLQQAPGQPGMEDVAQGMKLFGQ